jgi:hypothetical protein
MLAKRINTPPFALNGEDGSALLIDPTTDKWVPSVAAWNCGAAIVEVDRLVNNTPALVGAQQQNSPGRSWEGRGWAISAGESRVAKMTMYAWVEGNTSNPDIELRIDKSVNGAAWSQCFRFLGTGVFLASAGMWSHGYLISDAYCQVETLRITGTETSGNANQLMLTRTEITAGSGTQALNNVPSGYTTPIYLRAFSGTTEIVLVGLTKTS